MLYTVKLKNRSNGHTNHDDISDLPLTPSLVMIPTIVGPKKPGVVDIALDIPMMTPAYFGAISSGFTIKPLNANPKNPTATHRRAIVSTAPST